MKPSALAGLIAGALLAGAPALAADVAGDVGASATAGSAGYHRFALYSDAHWTARELEPYLWGQWSFDNDQGLLGLGGGVWKNLDDCLAVKGGAGAYVGRLRDDRQTASSFLLETGIEKAWEGRAAGAEYRLTDGTIGSPQESIRTANVLRGRGRGRVGSAGEPSLASYTYSELAAYGRIPAGAATLGLRLALGLPSYQRSIVSEEISAKVPVGRDWRARTAVALEQSTTRAVFFTVGGEYLF